MIRKPVDREVRLSRIDNILSDKKRIVSLAKEALTVFDFEKASERVKNGTKEN